jgi:hypothetical protein
MSCEDWEYDEQPIGESCDECGKTGEDLTGCPCCEMRFCGECLANFVTDAGCPACMELPQTLVKRLADMREVA